MKWASNGLAYEMELLSSYSFYPMMSVVHLEYYSLDEFDRSPPPLVATMTVDGQENYTIEGFLHQRGIRQTVVIEVNWRGYSLIGRPVGNEEVN